MQQPWYKKAWSYFSEILLESTSSEINNDLYLVLKKGQYQLCTQNAIYSYGDRYDNFRDTFLRMKMDHPPINDVLILGMGLGSIPYILEKSFNKEMNFTCVELDEEIIQWAEKYVFDELKSYIEVIHGDAFTFSYTTEQKYDMICIDVFMDDIIPEEYLEHDFIYDLQDLLNEDGVIIFNHLALYDKDVEAATTYYKETFSPCFENPTFLKLKTNMMMISDKRRII